MKKIASVFEQLFYNFEKPSKKDSIRKFFSNDLHFFRAKKSFKQKTYEHIQRVDENGVKFR
jgi:hypothetical protein